LDRIEHSNDTLGLPVLQIIAEKASFSAETMSSLPSKSSRETPDVTHNRISTPKETLIVDDKSNNL